MNVASLDLCKELHELSGWTKSDPRVFEIEKAWRPTPLASGEDYRLINIGPNTPEDIPAYGLGYLLQKLPDWTSVIKEGSYADIEPGKKFCAQIVNAGPLCFAATAEDALCKLAIELFKQKVLKKEAV